LPAIIISLLLLQLTFAASPRYEVIDLGTLGGDSSEAQAINNNGQIVGWAERADATRHAVLFDFNHPANNIDLGTLAGNWSEALSINIHGCTVGTSHTSQGIYHAALFDPSGPSANIDLGGLGGDFSNAYSINDHSQIVGSSRLYTWDWRATLFDPTGAGNNIDLGAGLSNPAGSDASCALSINNNGQIVGYAHTGTTSIHNRAILFDPSGSGNSIDLTPGEDDGGEACCINDNGQIVGWSWKTHGAALFDSTGNGRNTALGSLPGAEYSLAYSINNRSHIIGAVTFYDDVNDVSFGRAVLFDSTGSGNNKNLNHLIDRDSGWVLEVAKDINNNGWIVGYGINPVGETHAYLLIPKPVIIYVDDDANGANDGSSWPDAYNYLQDALTAAWSGDEIWVAQGIYKPDQGAAVTPGDREATFQLIDGVTLKGSYAGASSGDAASTDFGQPDPNARDIQLYETILTGDLNGDDAAVTNAKELLYEVTRRENSYHVVTSRVTSETAILDSFIITGGNADNYPYHNSGGGARNFGSLTLKNCTFSVNSADYRGGAMFNGEDSSAVLINCAFKVNLATDGGGMCNEDCDPTLTHVTFTGNLAESSEEAYGGGMCNAGASPTLIYCTFTGNSAFGYYEGGYGGGMYNGGFSSPTLSNCIFNRNSTDRGSGGMHNDRSSPTLMNCTFSRNAGSGMSNWENSSPTLTNCIFNGNAGGMYNDFSNPTVTECIFTGNSAKLSGGGMLNWYSSPKVNNCTFSTNSAGYHGGGMYNGYSSPTLTNCMFSGNTVGQRWGEAGGGMLNIAASSVVLTNCTFTGNSAPDGNALACLSRYWYYDPPSDLRLTNCILWDGDNGIWNNDNSAINITYSDVQDGWPGEGNIDADPCFVSLGYWDANGVWVDGNYRLLQDSPCIDAGNPNYIAEPNETDLDGRPRVINGRIDMGAYEYSPLISARIVPRTINLASKGKWITCYIWLGEEYDVADIEPNSVLLEGEIKPEEFSVDQQKQVAVLRFSREDVQPILEVGDIDLTIIGQLTDGTAFDATDTIKVIDKARKK